MKQSTSSSVSKGSSGAEMFKLKFSTSVGIQILTKESDQHRQGVLSSIFHEDEGRVFHGTSWATHNFNSKTVESKWLVGHDLPRQPISYSCNFKDSVDALVEGSKKFVDKSDDGESEIVQAAVETQEGAFDSGCGITGVVSGCSTTSSEHPGNDDLHQQSKNSVDTGGRLVVLMQSYGDLALRDVCHLKHNFEEQTLFQTQAVFTGESSPLQYGDLEIEELGGPRTPDMHPEVRRDERGCMIQAPYGEPVWRKTNQSGAGVNVELLVLNDDLDENFLLEHCEQADTLAPCHLPWLKQLVSLQGSSSEQKRVPSFSTESGVHVSEEKFGRLLNAESIESRQLTLIGDETICEVCLNVNRLALKIQAAYRGHVARKVIRSMHYAASRIQALYRGFLVRRKYLLTKIAVIRIQSVFRGRQIHLQYRQLREAVLTTQKLWRAHRSSNRQLRWEKASREVASFDVQASVTQSAMRLRRSENLAAVKLQALWRGYQQKQQYRIEQSRKFKAAVLLQRYWRKFCARRKQHKEQLEECLKRDAIVIQAFIRRYLAQKQYLLWRWSAVLIQNRWRTYKKHQLQHMEVAPGPSCLHISSGDSFLIMSSMEKTNTGSIEEDIEFPRSAAGRVHSTCQKHFDKYWEDGVNLSSFTLMDQTNTCMSHASCHYFDSEEKLQPISVVEKERKRMNCQEDWDDVEIDHLDECLDTCLASLRPLPPPSSVALREPDLLDLNVHKLPIAQVRSEDSCSLTPISTQETIAETEQALKCSDSLGKEGIRFDDCQHKRGALDIWPPFSKSKQQMTSTRAVFNQQRDKTKFEHFAEVFLLQHFIACQQHRARGAPPFPPYVPAGLPTTKELLRPLGESAQANAFSCELVDASEVDCRGSGVCGKRPAENSSKLVSTNAINQECSFDLVNEPIRQVTGADVVLDIVELLKYLGETCASPEPADVVIDINDNVCCANKVGMNQHNSVGAVAEALNVKQLGMADVNAVVLMIFTIVIYTRTLCRGALTWARESQRKL